jgi:hypothetical protein
MHPAVSANMQDNHMIAYVLKGAGFLEIMELPLNLQLGSSTATSHEIGCVANNVLRIRTAPSQTRLFYFLSRAEDNETCWAVTSICRHAGDVQLAIRKYRKWRNVHHTKPNIQRSKTMAKFNIAG